MLTTFRWLLCVVWKWNVFKKTLCLPSCKWPVDVNVVFACTGSFCKRCPFRSGRTCWEWLWSSVTWLVYQTAKRQVSLSCIYFLLSLMRFSPHHLLLIIDNWHRITVLQLLFVKNSLVSTYNSNRFVAVCFKFLFLGYSYSHLHFSIKISVTVNLYYIFQLSSFIFQFKLQFKLFIIAYNTDQYIFMTL